MRKQLEIRGFVPKGSVSAQRSLLVCQLIGEIKILLEQERKMEKMREMRKANETYQEQPQIAESRSAEPKVGSGC